MVVRQNVPLRVLNRLTAEGRRAGWAVRKNLWKLSGKRIVHLLHIGKTGGTAVAQALHAHSRTPTHVILKEGHRIQLRHVPPGEQIVFFLRDPITRFISGFYSRRRMGWPRYQGQWTPAESEAFSRFETPDAVGRALGSANVHERHGAEQAMRGIYHVQSHYWDWFDNEATFRSRQRDVLFVGRQERLADDFRVLTRLLHLPDAVQLPDDDVKSHRGALDDDKRMSAAAVGALRDWYREDYGFIKLCEGAVGLRPVQDPWEVRS